MSLPCIRHTIPPEGLFGLIRPFGVLVATGVMVGFSLGRRRAREIGLDSEVCANGMVWTVVGGFIMAHLVSVIFYFPEDIARDPLVLIKFWRQLSSFGGFIGGILGAFLFFRKEKVSLLQYAECILFGLVPGWVFGRMGCTTVHDHPGRPTDFFLGVRCGPGGSVEHDLGLYEMLFTVVLVVILYGIRRYRPFHGFHLALVLGLYAPVRFLLDYLRVEDRTYWGFTPGQYFAVGMLVVAILLVVNGQRLRRAGVYPGAEPQPAKASRTLEQRRQQRASRKRRRR